MGGAFTAVADDGSAAFWNPAGFATGAFFSLVADTNILDRQRTTLVALGTPPLGISYFRTAVSEDAGGSRLIAHHAGITLVQSIGARLAVGSTLKLVHAVASSGSASSSTDSFDADIGVMTHGAFGQVGLSIGNLLEPEFRTAQGTLRMARRLRAGVAVRARPTLTVAADADLTTAHTPAGDWREAAIGVEAHPFTRAWVRSGVHWNAAAPAATGTAPIGSIGGSFAVYGSTQAEAQVSFGSENGNRGWGLGLRFVF
jgi:hypothetical protein